MSTMIAAADAPLFRRVIIPAISLPRVRLPGGDALFAGVIAVIMGGLNTLIVATALSGAF